MNDDIQQLLNLRLKMMCSEVWLDRAISLIDYAR